MRNRPRQCRGRKENRKTDNEIDQIVYKLYDLTDEGIRLVEGVKFHSNVRNMQKIKVC